MMPETPFLRFLIAAPGAGVDPQRLEQLRRPAQAPSEPLGSLAQSYGLLSGEDVDRVLDEQRRTQRPFGEIAADLGLLTADQVEALVRFQHVRSAIEDAEALAVSGMLSPPRAMHLLVRFLVERSAGFIAADARAA